MIDSVDKMLPVASLSSKKLVFSAAQDADRALELGVFYLAVPDNIDLDVARQFGHDLLAPHTSYRNIPQYGELEGFIALDNNQQNKLALQRERWDAHYPPQIARFGRQLDEIGVAIMREVLGQSGIPDTLWEKASGGYALGKGTAFLNFVHYDTRSTALGLRPHTDYGFITILDATLPGLQIQINGEFVDVPVLPNHFVINFGEALHFITQYSNRCVGAVVHRVVTQCPENPTRHGIVYFANPNLDGLLWQFNAKGDAMGHSSVTGLFAQLEQRLTY